jgi:lipoate-protein ligase A
MECEHGWRLIVEDAAEGGAWHMSLDRAIQLERAEGRSPATLRLYRWLRPTVSLGRFQKPESVDMDVCHSEGIEVVRRFTGGRGVLHDDELTYAVIAGIEDGVPAGTMASYRLLCGAVVNAYQRVGIDASLTPRPRGQRASGACYLHATHSDVSVGGRKLSGSAQVWHRDVVLQHGSFVFSRDLERETRVFGLTAQQARELARRTITIGAQAPASVRQALATAVVEAFEHTVGTAFERGTPTESEMALARTLLPEVDVTSRPSIGQVISG